MGTVNPIQQRHLVAGAFHAASLVLGIPSSIAFVFLVWESVRLHFGPSGTATGATGNQLIDLFVQGFRLFGKLFAFLGGAAKWAFTLLAVASLVIIVAAVILFFIARGLHAGRAWARIFGILLALAALLVALVVLAALRRPVPIALSTTAAAASVWVIWVLGWRFA